MNFYSSSDDTIVAISTAPGMGAIGVVRISGKDAIPISEKIFKGKKPAEQKSHTVLFGRIVDASDKEIDEVVLTLFRGPNSYTGEDVIEISGHGSPYIMSQLLNVSTAAGARLALPGEFTQRAFLNGKLDLAQAEAVGDLIAATTAAAQQTALNQLRGGFSKDLNELRDQLIHFAAMIELELDFAEEDVEFADRKQFRELIEKLKSSTTKLINSFSLGNAIKNGISVAIIGKPNAGKSTLLNALLNEERAIVSDIAGTTRDTIEESLNIDGVLFRLIDTAGVRESKGDMIEDLGIERSKANAEKADLIMHLMDINDQMNEQPEWMEPYIHKTLTVFNKLDLQDDPPQIETTAESLNIAAKSGIGIDLLKTKLYEKAIGTTINTEDTIVTNARHHAALLRVAQSLDDLSNGMDNGLTGDLLALDIRTCLHYLGEITGRIEVDRDVLGKIFSSFCIGK